MELKVLSLEGKELRSISLADEVFGLPENDPVIYYAINNELANRRTGTACTKDRGEVHGTNRKPYAQKGTGRARQGDYKSPIYVGGGTAFGPKPKDFSYALPKQAKRLAMKTILSHKLREGSLQVIEDFTVTSAKTSDLCKKLEALNPGKKKARMVVVLADNDPMLKLAGRNIPWLSFLTYSRLNAHSLLYGHKLIVMQKAAEQLNAFYSAKEAK